MALLMLLLATSSLAVLTMFLAAAVVPNRVRQHFESFDGRIRIIALDDKFTTSRALLGGLVSDNHVQT
jgi:hypothetical protein